MIPDIKVVEIPETTKIFVVISIPESPNAPYAIENTTKIYIRTGNQSSPYKLSDLERIESLIHKRDRSSVLLKKIHDQLKSMNIGFHRSIGNPGTPNITITTCPLFFNRQISKLEATYTASRNFRLNGHNHFKISDPISRYQSGVICKLNHDGFYAQNICDIYGNVVFHNSLRYETRGIQSTDPEETNRKYLRFAEFIYLTVYNLKFAEYFYQTCNYRGEAQVIIELNNVLNQPILSVNDKWRERGNLFPIQNHISGQSVFSSEILSENIVNIISDAIYNLAWAFNQDYDSFTMEYIRKIVTHVLERYHIIQN